MFHRDYRSQVCVGNWEEDRLVEEEREQQYKRRLRNGELLCQKINYITAVLNSPEATSVITDGVVHFGDCIKICHYGNGTEFNVSLASDIPLHAFLQPDPLLGPPSICAIKDGPTVKRNTFTIKHKHDGNNSRRPLCFGETFFLSPSVLPNTYLSSQMITFGKSTEGMHHQEVFLSPGLSLYAQFKVIHPDQRWTVEKEGSPVPTELNKASREIVVLADRQNYPSAPVCGEFHGRLGWCSLLDVNENIIINHVFTNQALALENSPTRTMFGEVYEVSTHTYLSRSNQRGDRRNLWKFISAHPSS